MGYNMSAEVTRRGALDMQVCVPADWTDAQVIAFAEQSNPCGTRGGWQIRKEGDPDLSGDPEDYFLAELREIFSTDTVNHMLPYFNLVAYTQMRLNEWRYVAEVDGYLRVD